MSEVEPRWLSREEVEEIHDVMLEIGGGLQGLGDAPMLESALARPQNLLAYEDPSIFDLAASYAEIARHQAFNDGNKRTAFGAANLFLVLNGYQLQQAAYHEHADIMEKLGEGLISRDEVSAYFEERSLEIELEQAHETSTRDDLLQDYADQHAQEEDGRDLSRDHDMADDD